MDCKSANVLMMKYMDQVLTENEAKSLNGHIQRCKMCCEDFSVYENITEEFERQSVCLLEAPEDFELRVMEAVSLIAPDYCRVYSQDSVVGFVFGTFSVLFGVGVILSMYRQEIVESVSVYPYVGELMESAAAISESVAFYVGRAVDKLLFYLNEFSVLIESAKYGILAIIAALVTAQFVLYMKNKVEA